jgi:hypothetical protein
MTWLGDDRHAASAVGDERCAMEHDPGARPREHAGDRYLPGAVRVLGSTQRAAGDGEHRRGQPAGIPTPSGSSAGQRSTPGVTDSTFQPATAPRGPATAAHPGPTPHRSAARGSRPARSTARASARTRRRRGQTSPLPTRDTASRPPRPHQMACAAPRSSPDRRPLSCSSANVAAGGIAAGGLVQRGDPAP